jgi:hydrogenase maturation protease
VKSRVLCLGNELIADDGFGPAVARALAARDGIEAEVMVTAESGFYLLDYVHDCDQLIVVDTVMTGGVPGTLYEFHERDFPAAHCPSPHYVGLFETLAAGRGVGLHMPDAVLILACEARDLSSIGTPMSPEVQAAVPPAVERVEQMLLLPARSA